MAKKQTSSRVSTLAARLMRRLAAFPRATDADLVLVKAGHLRTLCASLLSQDETPGQGKRRRRK